MRTARYNKQIDEPERLEQSHKSERVNSKNNQKTNRSLKKQNTYTSDKHIEDLESRNQRLQQQINKIYSELQTQFETQKQQNQKQKHHLVPIDTPNEVLKKQLENAKQQVKIYEKEIKVIQQKQKGGTFAQKMIRLQNIIKQKDLVIEKLRAKMIEFTKTSNSNSKKLADNTGRQHLEAEIIKINYQIKFLKEKLTQSQKREQQKQVNAKKQLDYIKKIQDELIKNGVTELQIEEIKKSNIFNNIFDKISEVKSAKHTKGQLRKKIELEKINNNQKVQEIEELTIDRYAQLKNDLKTYKKLNSNYNKKFQDLSKKKFEDENLLIITKSKVIQKDKELEQLQNLLKELKKKVKVQNLKPKPNAFKPFEQNKQIRTMKQIIQINKPIKIINHHNHENLTHNSKGLSLSRVTDKKIIIQKNSSPQMVLNIPKKNKKNSSPQIVLNKPKYNQKKLYPQKTVLNQPNYNNQFAQSIQPKYNNQFQQIVLNQQKQQKLTNQDSHKNYKHDQKGSKTENSLAFTDRKIIPQNSYPQIIKVIVWTQKSTCSICGIQCYYKINNEIIAGLQHVKKNTNNQYNQNIFQLQDFDYLKRISGNLNSNNVIQYISLTSANNKNATYGKIKPNQKQFIFNIAEKEIPICVYGSLGIKQESGKPQMSYLQLLGFEISTDKYMNQKASLFVTQQET